VNLFAPLAALAWEHFRPYAPVLPAQEIARGQRWLLENFNAGGSQHGLLAWTLGALLPALALGLFATALGGLFELLGWIFEVLVLYFLLGFRRASFEAASIARALVAGDLEHARSKLTKWNPGLVAGDVQDELARQSLEETIKAALANLFGVLFWYWVAGITGAVLYSLSHSCREQWQGEDAFENITQQVVYWMDWLPARALGFSFAIVGNFQDAMECWRGQAQSWRDGNEGVILASGAGALGIRLGGTINVAECEVPRPELGMDEQPGPESIDAGVALIWRAALLWVAVAGLLWLGSL
jgi:adenosylcobinamide-phosphate synthase